MSVIIVAPEEEWAEIGAYFGALCEDSNGPVASYFLLWTRVQLTRADVCPLRYDLVRAEAELLRLIGQGSSLAEEIRLTSNCCGPTRCAPERTVGESTWL
jgi:hypothetical protein